MTYPETLPSKNADRFRAHGGLHWQGPVSGFEENAMFLDPEDAYAVQSTMMSGRRDS